MQNKEIAELGAVCGRFQVFHNDHLKYVLEAKKCCKHLIVGITSADPLMSPQEQSDPNRGRSVANPCTYYERMMIIEQSLFEIGLTYREFHIVPFPIGRPELIPYYIPQKAVCFFTIYDEWGMEKVNRLKEEGYDTEILWRSDTKGLSSSFIREQIAEGKRWADFVPNAAYKYIRQNKIDARITGMIKAEENTNETGCHRKI